MVAMIKFLSSIKLAITLITAIVFASIFATANPSMEVFSSTWFRILVLLFTANLLLCTVQGIPVMLKKLFIKVDDQNSLEECGHEIPITDVSDTENQLRKLLNGYKVQEKNTESKQTFLASKGVSSLLAPHLLHISIIIILIGAFLGTFGASGTIMFHIGGKMDMPERVAKGMAVQVDDFRTIYSDGGYVLNWESDLTVFVDGEKVATGVTKVNHPFRHAGVVFYQTGYGFRHLVGISGPEKEEEFYIIPDDTRFNIAGTDFEFDIRYFRDGPLIKIYDGANVLDAKRLSRGDIIELPNGEILEYGRLYPYTVLAVKTDPGVGTAMVGFILMMISSAMLWTTRHRMIYAVLDKENNKLLVKVVCKNKEIKEQIYAELYLLKTKEGE